jgi:hypothetical protein
MARATGSGPFAQSAARVSPYEVFQHEKVDALLPANVEKGADMGMREIGDGLRFPVEARAERWIRGEDGRQDLDGDRASEPGIPPLIDLTHTARA